jgi:DNA processing protein
MQSEMKIENYSLLCLSQINGIGSQRIRNLVAHFKSPEAIFKASFQELMQVEGIDKTLAGNIKQFRKNDFAEQQLERARKFGVTIINFWNDDYPKPLKSIANPPILLFISGTLQQIDCYSIAIVGTRHPSPYGKMQCEKFTHDLCMNGLTIVSGLARGIDTIAHKMVVASGCRTIAVLGSGVDCIYPEENRSLAEQIMKNGAIVSEFPMMTTPDAINFPRRNRIIAGLSLGTLIVEAGQKSGALITADFAVEQGREVFAIPGQINNPRSFGCHMLIQQGAKLVQSVEDIFEELGIETREIEEKKSTQIPLTNQERIVLSFLTSELQHIDDIALHSQLQTSQVLSILLSLELKNFVRQFPGKNFIKN